MEYEYHKMKEAYELGLPVPRPYELVEMDDRKGLVMERVEGLSFMEMIMNYLKECFDKGIPNQAVFDSEVIQNSIKSTAFILSGFHTQPCKLQETDKASLSYSCKNNEYLTAEEKRIVFGLIDTFARLFKESCCPRGFPGGV